MLASQGPGAEGCSLLWPDMWNPASGNNTKSPFNKGGAESVVWPPPAGHKAARPWLLIPWNSQSQ